MDVSCPSCKALYRLDAAKLPRGSVRTKCRRCGTAFSFRNPPPVLRSTAEGGAEAPAPPVQAAAPEPAPLKRTERDSMFEANAPPPRKTTAAPSAPAGAAAASPDASEEEILRARRAALQAPVWTVQVCGYQFQGVSMEQIKRWIREGRFKPDDMAGKDGTELQEAQSVKEMATYFRLVAHKFATRRPNFLPPCTAHLAADASQACTKCSRTLCDECAVKESIGAREILLCKHCNGDAKRLEKPREVVPFQHDLKTLFTFPFKGAGPFNLVFYAALAFFVGAFPKILFFILPFVFFVSCFLMSYNCRILRSAVQGDYATPGWLGDHPADDIIRGFKAFVLFIAVLLPTLIVMGGFLSIAGRSLAKSFMLGSAAPSLPDAVSPAGARWSFPPSVWAQEEQEESPQREGEPQWPYQEGMPYTMPQQPYPGQPPMGVPQQDFPQMPPQFMPFPGMPYPDEEGMPAPAPLPPPEPPKPPSQLVLDALKGLGLLLIALVPLVLVTLGAAFFYYPVAFMFLTLYNTLGTALNVPLMLNLVKRMRRDYFLMLGFAGALVVAFIIASVVLAVLALFVPLAGMILSSFVQTYLTFVYYHLLGRVVENNPVVFSLR